MINRSLADAMLTFLESAPAYVYLMDKDLRYVYLNKLARESPAYDTPDLEAVRGKRGEDFPLAMTVPSLAENDRMVLASGKHMLFEEAVMDLTLLAIKWPVRETTGEICGVGGISVDITEQSAERRAQVEWLARAVDSSTEIVEAISAGLAELAIAPMGLTHNED